MFDGGVEQRRAHTLTAPLGRDRDSDLDNPGLDRAQPDLADRNFVDLADEELGGRRAKLPREPRRVLLGRNLGGVERSSARPWLVCPGQQQIPIGLGGPSQRQRRRQLAVPQPAPSRRT
jgi:hypothetical protein